MKTRHIFMLILVLLVVATGWFLQKPGSGSATVESVRQGPDMFAQQIEVTVMNESGQPAYRIVAEQLRHSPETELFNLSRPAIDVTRPNGENWKITSERGQMTDKGDQVWFLGTVDILRRGDNSMHIRTSELLVKPNEELAETENAVSITTTGYEIDAVGLKADFRNRLLEFRSRVRGIIHAAG